MKAASFIALSVSFAVKMMAQPNLPAYSATQTSQRVQTLADGTHITLHDQKTLLYRDSQGRTRMEFTPALPQAATAKLASYSRIEINDLVAGIHYSLDSRTKIARRMVLNVQGSSGGSAGVRGVGGAVPTAGKSVATLIAAAGQTAGSAAQPGADHRENKRESLGTQMIEGELCDGNRTKTTIPVGAIGNDRDLVTVTENWISQELKVMVLSKRSDPRIGDSTTQLTDISRAEPDPALFMVPPDYTIQDEPIPGASKQ